MVWYSHLLKNFPELIVIHTVKGFGIVNKAEVDASLELSSCFNNPEEVGNLMSGSSAFSKPSLNIWKFMVHILLKPRLCPTLCDPMDCSLPGSSVHGILQAGILKWVAIPSPGALPNPGIEPASLTSPTVTGGFFTTSAI